MGQSSVSHILVFRHVRSRIEPSNRIKPIYPMKGSPSRTFTKAKRSLNASYWRLLPIKFLWMWPLLNIGPPLRYYLQLCSSIWPTFDASYFSFCCPWICSFAWICNDPVLFYMYPTHKRGHHQEKVTFPRFRQHRRSRFYQENIFHLDLDLDSLRNRSSVPCRRCLLDVAQCCKMMEAERFGFHFNTYSESNIRSECLNVRAGIYTNGALHGSALRRTASGSAFI